MTEQLELDGIIDASKDNWELKIEYDEFAESPRDWDSALGKFCVSNRCRYIKDESGLRAANELTWYDKKADRAKLESMGYIVLPLSVYDHSGVKIYIGEKCDDWDSAQIGWYIINKEEVRKACNIKRISEKWRERIIAIAKDEVKTFNAYYNGEVYNFTLSRNGEEVDSCGGFYDNSDKYLGFIESMYEYLPKEFRFSFTVEQAKEMAITPW